ncbi:DNA repair protein RecN [Gemmata obscuriglobus]|uniref:DNA repair protein RecN n=1 Tax=Gemmata obscuriglobus TaxID=114 RepID=A0A2Z3H328_9BACT|nr:DNA repair protein RecN [Gemmata obscuriglobus]AWM39261.1 DNA repair protein RecN [Gemmata obscuriglobus]QEG27681.1 DNA repair protein RecN [Gemmata obscuriglobus]VTS04887.1 dna repair protein : DNA repair protein RecN OS=Isosphaera pallida (strain ATCC 43644 / DSM 9630 / IS1B) GN=Isop_2126 PE=3 SV=1: SMC_N [Gemmata obscuriglobus UQM 2246]
MLREVSVQNLALIEDVRVELHAGFCAWTGETGAGKSLLLGALGLLLGERGSADLIRTGADELRVTGRFELTRPEQREAASQALQTAVEEDDLILTRRLSRSGRSSALVNDVPVAVSTLRRIGEMLVDVHGQRESYSLLQPAYQLELLDAFGRLTDLRKKYLEKAEKVRELRSQFKNLADARAARQRELALVRFEREDLNAAKLTPGELPALVKERERLVHAQSLAQFTSGVAARLVDNDGAVSEVVSRLIKEAHKWASFDPKLAEVSERLNALRPEIDDLADTCRDLAERFEADPERLGEVEKRIGLLKKLQTRYGKTPDELLAYRDTLDEKEAELQEQEDNLSGIDGHLRAAYAEMRDAANVLSKGRAKVAKKLAGDAQKHLADLGMPKAKLDAVIELINLPDDPMAGDIPAFGIDQLELILMANPGEPARPLRKVASGGELSRTMLALKTVLAAHDPVRTLVVFDEIDSNVGGRLGDMLGQKLSTLGQSHQVLCVTHLPQVASYAGYQWTIRKESTTKRTATTITPLLTDESRVEELAIMLRGESRSETTRKEAAEMLNAAKLLRAG